MKTAKIKICKKVIIDRSTSYPKAQEILENCFSEIAHELRYSAQGFTTWKKIKKHKPEAVATLTKSAFMAARAYINNLDWDVIEEFSDVLKLNKIPIKDFSIHIIDGDFNDINTFKMDLLFFTDELTLIDIFDSKLLLAFGDKITAITNNEAIETFMIELDKNIMITSFQ